MKYCSECASQNLADTAHETRCMDCGACRYKNPPTVANAVIWVRRSSDRKMGLLLIERGDGGAGFTAGYQAPEPLLRTVVRETEEEAGLSLSARADLWTLIHAETTPRCGENLLFYLYAEVLDEDDFPPFIPNMEARDRFVAVGGQTLKFPIAQRVFDAVLDAGPPSLRGDEVPVFSMRAAH